MAEKKRGLGRGLEALRGQVATPAASAAGSDAPPATLPGDELRTLPVDLLQRGKYQPRVDMREETLDELAASIKAQGVIQPVVVRPVGTPTAGASQRYEIIAGERRWRAAQRAGLQDIPAVVRRVPDEAAVAMALIENIQREDLNPLEEARALGRLIEEFELTHQQVADAVGRSRATVSNLLRLTELADEVQTLLAERQLDMGHARALLGLPARRQQVEVANLIVKKGLSVRDAEALVRRMAAGKTAGGAQGSSGRDPDVERLESDLTDRLGAKVEIRQASGGKGKLVISYHSLDELDGILGRLR
ncbi:MAG: ParB/RepB/Spo0J family partition protein [Steroidobacteraceae bacterium]